MPRIKDWVSAARLRTLPLSAAVIISGAALATDSDSFSLSVFLLTLLTAFLLQVISNFANDYGDFVKGTDNETRVGPMRAMQSGSINKSQMKLGLVVAIIICISSGITLLVVAFDSFWSQEALLFFSFGLIAIVAAIAYTVGRKAYGYFGFGDLFVFVFFGLLGVLGAKYLHAPEVNVADVLLASATGLLCVGVLHINNMRDRISDQAVNKNTLAVKFGKKGSRNYHFVVLGLSLILTTFYYLLQYQLLIALAITPLLFLLVRHGDKIKKLSPTSYNPLLKELSLITLFNALVVLIVSILC